MSLGTNRDYKTRNRLIDMRLQAHDKLMQKMILHGVSKDVASSNAYDLVIGKTLKQLKKMIQDWKADSISTDKSKQ